MISRARLASTTPGVVSAEATSTNAGSAIVEKGRGHLRTTGVVPAGKDLSFHGVRVRSWGTTTSSAVVGDAGTSHLPRLCRRRKY